MKLTCICCKHEQEFESPEAAFNAGWDCEPYFTVAPLCNLCPTSTIVCGWSHEKAHAHWKEHGRPEDFGGLCMPDHKFGDQKYCDETVEGGKAIVATLLDMLAGRGGEPDKPSESDKPAEPAEELKDDQAKG